MSMRRSGRASEMQSLSAMEGGGMRSKAKSVDSEGKDEAEAEDEVDVYDDTTIDSKKLSGEEEEIVSLKLEQATTAENSISEGNRDLDILTERSLASDTFSFLIYSKSLGSSTSLLAAIVFLLQIAIFVLVSIDIIDVENKGNPLNFPPNVEATVRITELLAISIAIITQDDVRKAVNLLRDGYDRDAFSDAFGCDVTLTKWALSVALRGTEGLLGLFVTFLLIMQSRTVLDLLLNFSAMEFVSLIDDVVFALTTEGFFGMGMMMQAKTMSLATYHMVHAPNSRKSSVLTAAYFVGLFAAMLTGWGVIYSNQVSGQYLCEKVFVQFDDDLVPSLGTFSGIYLLNRYNKFGGRVTYTNYAMIGYCSSKKIWTLTAPGSKEPNPCEDWMAASSESLDFDVTATAPSQWYARSQSGRVLPLDQSYLHCYDCKHEDDFCGESSKHGTCINNQCNCTQGRYGLRCEFDEPCSSLEVDPRSEGFVGNRVFASKFHRMENAYLSNRPIYASGVQNSPDVNADILMFTGRRWVLSSVRSMALLNDISHEESSQSDRIVSYLDSGLHGFYSDYEVFFISEAVSIDSRADVIAYPLGLEWHPALVQIDDEVQGPDLTRDVDINFICAECNNTTNPCSFEATCLIGGTCERECTHGSSGTLCQIPPLANARCDSYFNKPDFEYDGGDCCENSCVSTDTFTCGKDDTGYIDVGYPECRATNTDLWSLSGNPVYGVNSAARSGSSVALGSNGGTILAVGDPGASIARLYDKDGSEWIQRGQILEGPPNSDFGFAVSLSGESMNVKKNPYTSPLVTLAVGGPGAALVRVYQCSTNGCVQVGGDITGVAGSRFGASIALSTDGKSIAVGGPPATSECSYGCHSGYAEVYKRSNNGDWQLHGNPISVPSYWRRNLAIALYQMQHYVSLSGNGEYLAVGRIEGEVEPGPSFESATLVTQVYKWNVTETNNGTHSFTTEAYSPIAGGISHQHFLGESARSFWPQQSIKLSDDGHQIAIGHYRSVSVYSLNTTNWAPREVDLDIAQSGLVGWSVDLSADGSTLVIGTSTESHEITDGSIRVLKWNGTHYSPFFNGLPSGEMSAVALSRDGKSLAVGLPFDGKQGGVTRVYNFHPLIECDGNLELLRLSFTTDSNPEETRWALEIGANEQILSQSYDGIPFTTFVEEYCIPVGVCVKFNVFDESGDGLNTPGVYSLFLGGKEVAQGGQFGYIDMKRIGDCNCSPGTSLFSLVATTNQMSMNWALTHKNRLTDSWLMGGDVFEGVALGSQENQYATSVIEECIPIDCWTITLYPDCFMDSSCYRVPRGEWELSGAVSASGEEFCTITADFGGECSPNQPIECEAGSELVRIEITFNDQPWDAYWFLEDRDTGEYILDGSNAIIVPGSNLHEEVCKPADACFYFVLANSSGTSGFKLFLDNTEIVTSSTIVPLGDCAN